MIPQAFTTRDMSEAYKWLQTLPASVREEMKSMEQVVSLYLRAKRLGGHLPTKEEIANLTPPQQEASKASQDFQKTLKNLRHELDQFDFAPSPQTANPALEPHPAPTARAATIPSKPAAPSQPLNEPHAESHPSTAHLMAALRLDPKSRQIVNEIRDGLNLSSDVEVIRMSLVLAHKSLKDLLK